MNPFLIGAFIVAIIALAVVLGHGFHSARVSADAMVQAERETARQIQRWADAGPANVHALTDLAYAIAKDKGWHDKPREVGTVLALVHSEISEALEEWRNGKDLREVYYEDGGKPCGYPIELADVLVRIFDHAGAEHIDLHRALAMKMAYNARRDYRHGGKRA